MSLSQVGGQPAKHHLYFWVRDRLELHQEKLGIHTRSISMAGQNNSNLTDLFMKEYSNLRTLSADSSADRGFHGLTKPRTI